MSLNITSLGGMCPVQAEGDFNGNPFYFRARHGIWTLDVVEPLLDPVTGEPIFHREGVDPSRGYMKVQDVKAILEKSFKEFAP